MKVRESGFTFVELILVISIVLVVGAFSSVYFSNFLNKNAVSNARDSLMGQLRKAQMYSMVGRENTGWGVALSGSNLVLFAGNTYATRNTAFDETTRINSSVSFSGFSEIDFFRLTGSPSATGTIGISNVNSSKSLNVNSEGL